MANSNSKSKFRAFILGSALFSFSFPLVANQQIQQQVIKGADIPKFVDPLPIPKRANGTKHLTVTSEEFQQKMLPNSFYKKLPHSVTYKSVLTGKPVFTIDPRKGTYLWGYKIDDGKHVHGPSFPAPTIEAEHGVRTKVEYINNLHRFTDEKGRHLEGPLLQKFLTVDLSFQWANPLRWPQFGQGVDTYDPTTYPFGTGLPQANPGIYEGPQPTVPHLHGGETPSYADGDPNSWFTPHNKRTGQSFVTSKYIYPNTQPATTLWYHDHVLGETRLNVFAGLAGFYLVRGKPESSVTPALPHGEYEIELAIADRQFDTHGQLFFPDGNPLDAGLNGPPPNPDLNTYAIPEFFGDVNCVNGKSWPYLEVEPRRYRFRILNASNARMYALFLTQKGSSQQLTNPIIWQIGTDGGLLNRPVNLNSFIPYTYNPNNQCLSKKKRQAGKTQNLGPVFTAPRLFLAPAERADIIIDFAGLEGQTLVLNNDAPAPFPGGGTELDPDVEGLVMQFRVKKQSSSHDKSFNPAAPDAKLRKGGNRIVRLTKRSGKLAPGVVPNETRALIMIEQEDPYSNAPVVVTLNNTSYDGRNPYNNKPLQDSVPYNKKSVFVTELPQIGSTEIWEIINMTPDAHPIHIHLIQFQILNRQPFYLGNIAPPFVCASSYRNLYENLWNAFPKRPPGVPPGTVYTFGPPLPYLSTPKLGGNPDVTPFLLGKPVKCDANEFGWKDTVKMYPGTVTRLAVRWAPQMVPVDGVKPGQNRFKFDPTAKLGVKDDGFGYPGGSGYVWHCHITDHEDNMMMRPLQLRKHPQRPKK